MTNAQSAPWVLAFHSVITYSRACCGTPRGQNGGHPADVQGRALQTCRASVSTPRLRNRRRKASSQYLMRTFVYWHQRNSEKTLTADQSSKNYMLPLKHTVTRQQCCPHYRRKWKRGQHKQNVYSGKWNYHDTVPWKREEEQGWTWLGIISKPCCTILQGRHLYMTICAKL